MKLVVRASDMPIPIVVLLPNAAIPTLLRLAKAGDTAIPPQKAAELARILRGMRHFTLLEVENKDVRIRATL